MGLNAAIELKNISKSFGSIIANKDVCLTVNRGEILSILGENGSGKTTLMNMIAGIYYPDHGQIFIDGKEVVIRSPKDALDYKIGMVHQHFKLVDVFSATENIILGLDEGKFNVKKSAERIKKISEQYGFDIDPNKKIYEMSVSEKQTVEIIKVLYRGADILILDEPTAVLTPQETLFTLMMNYIATQIVAYFCYKWSNPKGSGHIGVINSVSHNGWLPSLGGQDYLLNILIVAALTVFMYIYLKYSKHGYELSVVGESENTARYIGINVKKVIMRTMLLSGALCGVTGLLLVSGTDHTIATNTVGGRGFTAIMVSWLAKFNPAYMILTSLLIVFFQKGAIQISTSLGLNDSFADIITGIIIFFIIGSEFFINYSVKFRSKEAKA